MTNYIEMVRSDKGVLPRDPSCTPAEFHRVLQLLADPSFNGRRMRALATSVSAYPFADAEYLKTLTIPDDRRHLVAIAISGTPNPAVYEHVVSLIENIGDRSLRFPKSFVSSPDMAGARNVLGALLSGFSDGRIVGIERLLLAWITGAVLTREQSDATVSVLLERSEFNGHWFSIVSKLEEDVAVPWLIEAASSQSVEAASYALDSLRRRGVEVPERPLRNVARSLVGAGALIEIGFPLEALRPLNPELQFASSLAKCAMAWKFICEAVLHWEWTLDREDLEIEQIGMVDGQSVETDGLIFVFRYRAPRAGYPKWMVGISGPYSHQEEPARHLGGLDYTQADIGLIEGTTEQAVEELLGVTASFWSLSAKPKQQD